MNRSVLRGIVLIALTCAVIVGLVLAPGSKGNSKNHPPNDDPWKLVSYDPDTKYGTYLGNGFISTRIKGDGVGSQDGQPLPCYMAGLYDDEKLIPIPTWSDLRFYDGKTQFTIDKDAPYKQTLDMKTGILTTEATWRAGRKSLNGKIEVVVSRAQPNVGLVRAEMVPDFDGEIRVESPDHPVSNVLAVVSRGNEPGPNPSASVLSCRTSESQIALATAKKLLPSSRIQVKRGSRSDVVSYACAVSHSDADIATSLALDKIKKAVDFGPKLVSDHKSAWARLWERDIIIEGSKRDQQAVRACKFYLLQSVREGSDWSIPPMGLSDAAFSGHVFWDADLWMFPALILQHPELAKSIVDYRYKTLPGALANAKVDGFSGAQYAWESGYTGIEDTPPGLAYRHERHINGDIAISQWQYYLATGDIDWLKTRGYPVIEATADYWVSRAKFVPDKSRYEILQVVPPDENAELVDNSAYTNVIAQINLRLAIQAAKLSGKRANPKWASVADKMYIPYDAANKRFIAFDDYQGFTAKQADTEMIAYPLQYKIPGESMTDIYRSNFDFYAPKVHKNGPAMIHSVHSVINARLGDRDKAYANFVTSFKPYLRGPFRYFNEKASLTYENMCFLTGAAGPVQAITFGLVGAHMDYFPTDPTQAELTFSPCLPKQWKSLKLTGVQWRGKTMDVIVTPGDHVRIE